MRVPVPHNSSLPLVSIILFTPKGEVTTTVDDSHYLGGHPVAGRRSGRRGGRVLVLSRPGPPAAVWLRPGVLLRAANAESRVRSAVEPPPVEPAP